MSLRNALALWLAFSILGLFAPARRASADPITLYTAYYPNYDSATAKDNADGGTSKDTYVYSLPAAPTTTDYDGTSTASVTSNLSTSLLQFEFSHSITDPNSFANGDNIIYFTAGVNTTYSISGTLNVTGGFSSEQLYAILDDNTTDTDIYRYTTVSSNNTQTFDSSGGPLTGLLTAGDVYSFRASDSLYGGDAALTGSTQISFTQPSVVPEPSSWIMLGLGCLLPLGLHLSRRRTPA